MTYLDDQNQKYIVLRMENNVDLIGPVTRGMDGKSKNDFPAYSITKLRRVVGARGGSIVAGDKGPKAFGDFKVRLLCSAGHNFGMDARKILKGNWCQQCSAAEKMRKVRSELKRTKKSSKSKVGRPPVHSLGRAPKQKYELPRPHKEFGAYLKELRIKIGLGQREVADQLGYAVAQHLSNFECGIALPPVWRLKAMKELYGADPELMSEKYAEAHRQSLLTALRSNL